MRTLPRDGFTLIEIMVVFTLIAILGALTIPRLNTTGFKADAAMHVVQSFMQQGQRSAVQRQSNVVVSVDTADNRIRLWNDANNNMQLDDGETTRSMTLEEGSHFAVPPVGVNGGEPESPVVSTNTKVSPDGYPSIIFRRDGAASGSVDIYLRAASSDLNDFRAISVTQATGRVDLFRYGNGAWRKAR
jgi:prepilin-type N-terminal cleavage/methylation domain-containing protein